MSTWKMSPTLRMSSPGCVHIYFCGVRGYSHWPLQVQVVTCSRCSNDLDGPTTPRMPKKKKKRREKKDKEKKKKKPKAPV